MLPLPPVLVSAPAARSLCCRRQSLSAAETSPEAVASLRRLVPLRSHHRRRVLASAQALERLRDRQQGEADGRDSFVPATARPWCLGLHQLDVVESLPGRSRPRVHTLSADGGGAKARECRAVGVESLRRAASETECEMRAKLSRLRMRDLAVFAAVAGIVAVAAVFAAHEVGLDGSGAGAQSSPLTLILSAPKICETGHGIGGDHSTRLYDGDGNPTGWKDEFLGWFDIAEVPITWRVTGGVGPYTLEIDGETRDATHEYRGARGKASVSCAITTVEPFIFTTEGGTPPTRAYRADPDVDSGVKTIQAVVTDANGDTAEATDDVYVILSTGDHEHVLRAEKTYRVFGALITIPSGIDMRIGARESGDDGTEAQELYVESTNQHASVWFSLPSFTVITRVIPDGVRGTDAGVDLNAKFDELIASINRSPVQ